MKDYYKDHHNIKDAYKQLLNERIHCSLAIEKRIKEVVKSVADPNAGIWFYDPIFNKAKSEDSVLQSLETALADIEKKIREMSPEDKRYVN